MNSKGKVPLEYLTRKLMTFLAIICALVMAFNMIVILCDVFMRYVKNAPIQGATELVAIMMAYVGYFGLGYTLMYNKHIQMNALYLKNKGRYKHIADVIIYTIIAVTMIVLCCVTFDVFVSSFSRMERANSTNVIYVWIGKAGCFIGCIGMLLQAFVMLASSIIKAVRYPDVKDEDPAYDQQELP